MSAGLVFSRACGLGLLVLSLGACAQAPVRDPTLGVHVAKDGTLYPNASAQFGPLRVGGSAGGGLVSTGFGPFRISGGF